MCLLQRGQPEKRVAQLKEMLKNCVLCPHQCQVDRTSGEKEYCKTLEKSVVSGEEAHFGEERELVWRYGSGTIFFSHCNLKCVFCQNYEISCCGLGQEMSGRQLADTDKIMDFIVQELGPDTYVNIMAQYYPAHQAYNYPELSRSITKKEYQQAVSAAKAAGLKGLVHSL